MKLATLLHNPAAGAGRHSAAELLDLLRAAGYRVSYRSTKKRGDMRALGRARGIIFAAGGDGTVHKLAKQVLGRGKTVALLPLGTANNIARSLGVAGEPAAIVAGLPRMCRVELDAGIIKGPWGTSVFLESAGAGLFAEVMARLDGRRKPRRVAAGRRETTPFAAGEGPLQNALRALREALPRFRAQASEVSIDGKVMSGRYLLLEAMNIAFIGPNLHLGPDADPSDGYLDFVLLGEDHREEFLGYLTHRLEGGHMAPRLAVVRGRRLRFAWRGAKLHIDDQAVPMRGRRKAGGTVIEIGVKRRALAFLVPARGAWRRPRR